MSNIKLKDHSWATEGIMDTTQNKTQKVINSEVQAALSDESDTRASADTTINNKLGSVTMGTTATTVTGAIAEHESDISGINTKIGSTTMGTTATTLTGAVSELKGSLNTLDSDVSALEGSLNAVCLRAAVKTISGNGTSSNTLTGLTADHVVGNWGLFSDANCTTPIPENSPPCDITITTAANAWSVTIANFSSTFYLRPTFILKQN